jgi:hypothetical protein
MDQNSRNNQGRFVSGHKGAKPKGAMNKSTREYMARLEKISNILESNLEENLASLSKKDQIKFWLEVQKIRHARMSRFPEPEPEKERIDKIVFEVVEGGPPPAEVQAELSKSSPAVPVNSQPPGHNTQSTEPIQYGTADAGKVKRTNSFRTIRSF